VNLSELQIRAKVRTPWQAVDLGALMARRWFLPLWLAWLVPAGLCFLLLSLVFNQNPWVVMLVIWWLKPLLERWPLLLLSRFVFNEHSIRGLTRRQLLGTLVFGALPVLLWRRFDPWRAFSQPITVLEKQKGPQRKSRWRILSSNCSSAASWMTVVLAHVEFLLMMAGPVLVMMLLGDQIEIDTWLFLGDDGNLLAHASNAFALLCMSVVAPFYVAGGFCLYINRRIELEAWDLDLLFRRIARQRSEQSAASSATLASLLCGSLLLITALTVLPAGGVLAAESAGSMMPEQSKEEVLTLLESPPFVVEEEVTQWRWKEGEASEDASSDWLSDWLIDWLDNQDAMSLDGSGLFQVAEAVVWAGIAVLLILLARVLMRYLRAPDMLPDPEKTVVEAPKVLMGMSIDAGSLPQDINAAVAAALDQGDMRAALSLVYRYALHRLVHHHGVEVESWHTELECAAAVRRHAELVLDGVFDRLTRVWLRLAYAHELPSRAVIEQLLVSLQKVLK